MKILYREKKFRSETQSIIYKADQIIREYSAQGYSLTLRQLYYQFVARGFLGNTDANYNRLGSIIADARMAGLISWTAIVDRGRNLMGWPTVSGPEATIREAIDDHHIDLWEGQDYHVEVWVEKEALRDVIRRPSNKWGVNYFACKGYVSASEMWKAGRRLYWKHLDGKKPIVLHLGDHDPSGIDMTRDIRSRLNEYGVEPDERGEDWDIWTMGDYEEYNIENNWPIEVRRIALNMDQIEQYNPPPDPAKVSDSRFHSYASKYGYSSWELDALEPKVLNDLIDREIQSIVDLDKWKKRKAEEDKHKEELERISANYHDIIDWLNEKDEDEDE